LEDLGNDIGCSEWWAITTDYYYQQASGNDSKASPVEYISNQVRVVQSANDTTYSRGKSLDYDDIPMLIQAQFNKGSLPEADPNGLYVVFTDQRTKVLDFCKYYCGYHWYFKGNQTGREIPYILVGNPKVCGTLPNACSVQDTSPNGDGPADAMASILAHEITEAATDPFIDAWQVYFPDGSSQENADICAWIFDPIKKVANSSAYYNVEMGSRKYLIQSNWDLASKTCMIGKNVSQQNCSKEISTKVTSTTIGTKIAVESSKPIPPVSPGKINKSSIEITLDDERLKRNNFVVYLAVGLGVGVGLALISAFLFMRYRWQLKQGDGKRSSQSSVGNRVGVIKSKVLKPSPSAIQEGLI
jgi:hypothetical protein